MWKRANSAALQYTAMSWSISISMLDSPCQGRVGKLQSIYMYCLIKCVHLDQIEKFHMRWKYLPFKRSLLKSGVKLYLIITIFSHSAMVSFTLHYQIVALELSSTSHNLNVWKPQSTRFPKIYRNISYFKAQ